MRQDLDRGHQVTDGGRHFQFVESKTCTFPKIVSLVTQFDAAFCTIKKRGRQGRIAIRGITVDYLTNVGVHTENLLDHQHASFWRSFRHRQPGIQLETIT